MNLLEMAVKYKIKNFVYASSSSVYGNNKKLPFSESDSVDTPISPYAASKKCCELMAHVYSHIYKLADDGTAIFHRLWPVGPAGYGAFSVHGRNSQRRADQGFQSRKNDPQFHLC